MSKKKTIVKNLNAIQNFGAMNILCTDKTGTLTCDKIVLEKYINADGSNDEQQTDIAPRLLQQLLSDRAKESDGQSHPLARKGTETGTSEG